MNMYFTIGFFDKNGNTWTGAIWANTEREAREKFKKYCPHFTINFVKKGLLSMDIIYISYDTEDNL